MRVYCFAVRYLRLRQIERRDETASFPYASLGQFGKGCIALTFHDYLNRQQASHCQTPTHNGRNVILKCTIGTIENAYKAIHFPIKMCSHI